MDKFTDAELRELLKAALSNPDDPRIEQAIRARNMRIIRAYMRMMHRPPGAGKPGKLPPPMSHG